MDATAEMQTFLRVMVVALVDNTGEVHVTTVRYADGVTTFAIRVAPGDVGKLIGKQGRTARSLRTIVGAAAMKYGQRFAIDIVETDKVERRAA